jgi:two-component system alkaline phosphatase synthesis response regulator PhoP
MQKIFCVEDDLNIRELVIYALKSRGYQAKGFKDSKDFFAQLEMEKPDLVLLDIMLPGEDGITVLKKLRSSPSTRYIPIMMLTAKSTEYDKVLGLDSGADDYLTKPFGVLELLSRVKALLRRANSLTSQRLTVGEIVLDNEKRSVYAKGELVTLTFKEFELLKFLMENKGIVLSREKIMEAVWGFDFEGESRTVDVHINTLRHKLGEIGSEIRTVRGVGYKIGG